ncbi:MAG TPA: MFS transporter [Candidatus Binataceae bacterium]|nr:MFS transporter [Candidatus Binataceae bacterium]
MRLQPPEIPTRPLTALEASALATVRRNLLPFLFVLYIVAYLDRINVGFASLQMNRALGLSDAVFGFGAGLFFIGYFLFEIPSNLVLKRVGARRWIARIMVSWGLVAIAMMFVRGARSFYAMRFLLGIAEAGFFPGVIFYLTRWFPAREQARAIALFMTATAIAGVIAGPVSGALLTMHGTLGLAGWQWLFMMEGLPALGLGIIVALRLPDDPAQARWLSADERRALANLLSRENDASRRAKKLDLGEGLAHGRVWLLALIYFGLIAGNYGVILWLPQIVAGFRARSDFAIGMISTAPFIIGALAMVQVGRLSDRRGERRWHLAGSIFAGAAGLIAAAAARNPAFEFAAICLAAAGIFSALGPFWAIPPAFLEGTAAAGGIALINSLGNLGGFVGPYVVGIVRQATGGFAGGLAVLAFSLVCSAALATRAEDRAVRETHGGTGTILIPEAQEQKSR